MAGFSNLFGGDVGGAGADDSENPSATGDENGPDEAHEAHEDGAEGHDLSLGTDPHDLGDAAHSLGLDDSLA